jgi:hypothetical protein
MANADLRNPFRATTTYINKFKKNQLNYYLKTHYTGKFFKRIFAPRHKFGACVQSCANEIHA